MATVDGPGTRSTPIRRVLRRRSDRLSERAWQRLHLGLAGGDPAGQVACAWSVAQDLMGCYQHSDPAAARDAADRLITDARACPISEIARIGRTLLAWRPEFLAHFDHPDVSNGRIRQDHLTSGIRTRRPRFVA